MPERKMTRNEGKRAWRMKEKARDAGKTTSQHGTVYKRTSSAAKKHAEARKKIKLMRKG